MKLGIGSYTFYRAVGAPGFRPPDPLNAFDLLDIAMAMEVFVLQVCDNLPLTALKEAEQAAFAAEAAARGIALEVGARGLDMADLRANLRLAERVGSPILRLVLSGDRGAPAQEEAVAVLRPLLPDLAGAGVRLAIENTEHYPAQALARMVEDLGPETAGICLDTANSVGGLETPEYTAETLAPYVLNMHVKDFVIRRESGQVGFVVEGCTAGKGLLDIPGLLGVLRKAGRDVNAILEVWTPLGDTWDETLARERGWVEESVAYLRTVIPD